MTRVISTFAPTGFILGTLPPTKRAQMSLSGRQLVGSLSSRAFFVLVVAVALLGASLALAVGSTASEWQLISMQIGSSASLIVVRK